MVKFIQEKRKISGSVIDEAGGPIPGANVFVEGTADDRNKLMAEINDRGVPCTAGSCSEVYLEKAFAKTVFRPKTRLPNAKLLGETSLMFMCHPTLASDEINQTCEALETAAFKCL